MVEANERRTEFEAVIGLEIHVQLETNTKLFCGCPVQFDAPPNTLVCPVCLGLPGALPVTNEPAIELAARAALGLGCEIQSKSAFARKHYFYPDLPKGYQITQFDSPLAVAGELEITSEAGDPVTVRIERLHLEEDAGKSVHDRFIDQTALDFNRAGIPLIEVVTEPDLRSPRDARSFLTRLKRNLRYLDVSDCNMERGSLRVDANVSVRREQDTELGTRTELKNLNSFSQLEKALVHEIGRHTSLIEAGEPVSHETLRWDAGLGAARPMRSKEEQHDYRYFPEPDLPPVRIEEASVVRARASLPELPGPKERRFVEAYGVTPGDAAVLASTRAIADFFEAVARHESIEPRIAANWMTRDVLAACNERGVEIEELEIAPGSLVELIGLVAERKLTRALAGAVLGKMIAGGRTAAQIVAEESLGTVEDEEQIEGWADWVIERHAAEAERYRNGEEKLLTFLVGQAMKRSKGRADPERLRRALVARL